MNITSNNTMIFAREFDGKMHYRAGLSFKRQDEKYEKGYIDVRFPKGIEIADKTKINITKGFLTFYKTKENKDVFYIVIQEYTTNSEVKEEKQEDVYSQFGSQITIDELDDNLILPF